VSARAPTSAPTALPSAAAEPEPERSTTSITFSPHAAPTPGLPAIGGGPVGSEVAVGSVVVVGSEDAVGSDVAAGADVRGGSADFEGKLVTGGCVDSGGAVVAVIPVVSDGSVSVGCMTSAGAVSGGAAGSVGGGASTGCIVSAGDVASPGRLGRAEPAITAPSATSSDKLTSRLSRPSRRIRSSRFTCTPVSRTVEADQDFAGEPAVVHQAITVAGDVSTKAQKVATRRRAVPDGRPKAARRPRTAQPRDVRCLKEGTQARRSASRPDLGRIDVAPPRRATPRPPAHDPRR
jgi:hypothetical protein